MNGRELNVIDGFEYGEKMGHAQHLDRKETDARSNSERLIDLSNELGVCLAGYMQRRATDETRLYNAGGLPVELVLPAGEHDEYFQNTLNYIVGFGDVELGRTLSRIDAYRDAAM